jgi:hypothetical protein
MRARKSIGDDSAGALQFLEGGLVIRAQLPDGTEPVPTRGAIELRFQTDLFFFNHDVLAGVREPAGECICEILAVG